MKKIKILHQVLDPRGIGGVSAEFRALSRSSLGKFIDFHQMVLTDFRPGVNFHDVRFYYNNIKAVQPDIIHIRGAAVDGLNAVIAAKLANKGKILVTVHGMYSDLVYIHPIKKWISKNIIERLIYGLADGISCVCRNAEERKYFDRYRGKMLPYVYNRMPVFNVEKHIEYRKTIRAKNNIPEDAVVGLYVGRITREKGVEVLVNALSELKENWPARLVILVVGDGDYFETMKARCEEFADHLRFMGAWQEVEPFYGAADFFIQPSLHENHSISLLEAAAAKLPSIATECGGNSEIVQKDIGILIPTNDTVALEKAIVDMCNDDVRDSYKQALIGHDFSRFEDVEVDAALIKMYLRLMEM